MTVASLTSLPPSPQNVFLGDLNDFIEPSQACVNPLFKTPVTDADKAVADKSDKSGLAKIQLDSSIFDELEYVPPVKPNLIKQDANQKATVSLADCLACSGCVTSAETVLITQQSTSEFASAVERGSYDRRVVSISP